MNPQFGNTIFVFSFLLFMDIFLRVSTEKSHFRAAVYEHALILPMQRMFKVDRATALKNMMKNVDIFKQPVAAASQQNVDIIVFPEDGVYGFDWKREALEPYLEYIPDPMEKWNPCDHPEKYNNTEIQRHLSCFAKDASLYLVANIGDRQPCAEDDQTCPEDGHYQFNTNVVYNPKGELIAKYHKINLFYEKQFDKPKIPRTVTFDTPFGKFAVFTCFDILFKMPAIESLTPDVGNVIFPTAWMDALPLLAAIQFHSAFAAAAKVNLLAANINLPTLRFHGSGIYSPNGYAAFQYTDSRGGKLLIADLPVVKSNAFANASENLVPVFNDSYNDMPDTFDSYVFHDKFTFTPIKSNKGSLSVCNGDLCCYLNYETNSDLTEYFAFGAFDGLHTYQGTYYLQICTLVKCKSSNWSTCGEPVKDSVSKFSRVKMTGTFGTPFIFPEILLTKNGDLKLASQGSWSYNNGSLESENGLELPVLSVSLFARDYDRDIAANTMQSWFLITFASILSFMNM